MDNSSLSHTKWNCTYHIVFIPKYRRKVMYGQVKGEIKEFLKRLCGYKQVDILDGSVCIDHVHMCVKVPPKISISEFMGYLKGRTYALDGLKLQPQEFSKCLKTIKNPLKHLTFEK